VDKPSDEGDPETVKKEPDQYLRDPEEDEEKGEGLTDSGGDQAEDEDPARVDPYLDTKGFADTP